MTPPVGVLLAAGAGRRSGGPKALRSGADSTPWVVSTVRTMIIGGCARVIVCIGAAAPEARAALRGEANVQIVEVDDWDQGQSASVRAGLASAHESGAATVLVHLVDLPDVGPDVVGRVITAGGADPAALARASYAGHPGHPVLIGQTHLQPVITSVSGDRGAGAYLAEHHTQLVECGDLASGVDVDHP